MAAELAGASQLRIIFRHMLPSFLSHIIAATSLALPAMIISETSLSLPRPRPAAAGDHLGHPAAGRAEHRDAGARALAARAAVPVIIVILAFNFLGDGLRDAADPYG